MNTEQQFLEQSARQDKFDEIYNNKMQLKASVIDAKNMFVEAGRAAGKTVWFARRFMDVGYSMPGELSFFGHKTYIALLTNVVPSLLNYLKTPQGVYGNPMLREGKDFVAGEKDLPRHFNPPRYPIENPNHSIVLANGHHYRLVSSDQPDSVAGASGVHAFIEEMKHSKGDKVKTRIFPALRGGAPMIRKSHYWGGITGVSDTARVDLGEDDWFMAYEKQINPELIREIVTVFFHINEALYNIETYRRQISESKDPSVVVQLQEKISRHQRVVDRWSPTLSTMRKAATYYLKASTFVNKDMLGFEFFKTQFESLQQEEFLTAIANIRPKKVADLFFSGWDDAKHTFDDSYNIDVYKINIKDEFKLDASCLKYLDREKPLIIGYDPGHFSSIVVAQEDRKSNTIRILKEFYVWIPKNQGDLASMIYEFFGPTMKNKKIVFYYDRAGNKTRAEHDKIVTDARIMQSELKKCGFNVDMKNEKQRTIFYYEHFKLLQMMLGENLRTFPRLRVDENECKNLVSAINISPVDRRDGKIILDKSSERKVAPQHQAALSTQLPSALMYLLFGQYSHLLPNDIRKSYDLVEHIS